MEIVQLVDQSAAEAMAQVAELQRSLRAVARDCEQGSFDACEEEIHRLVGAIVSMRNAAELLKRVVATPEFLSRAG